MSQHSSLRTPEIRKARIADSLIPEIEAMMANHPGKLLTFTAAVNFILEAALPFVREDLDNMETRLRKKSE